MYILNDLINCLEKWAPPSLAERWDNVGLMIGSRKAPVRKVLCALDINKELVQEAMNQQIDCIISHHPFLFKGIKAIDYDTSKGELIKLLIENHISVYSMHTNFDITEGGTNDILSHLLQLKEVLPLSILEGHLTLKENESPKGIGRYGKCEPISLKDLSLKLKEILQTPYVRVVGDQQKTLNKIALCSGSGGEYIKDAAAVADVFITGDVKFHEAQAALERGLCLIDVGHYPSENISIAYIKEYILKFLPKLEVKCSQIDGEMFKYI